MPGSGGRLLRIWFCRGRGRCCRYAEEPWFCSAPVAKAPRGPHSEISTASQARGSGGCAHISGNSARVRSKRLRLPTAHVVERCKCRPSPMASQMRRASESSLVSHGGAVSHTGDTVSRRAVRPLRECDDRQQLHDGVRAHLEQQVQRMEPLCPR